MREGEATPRRERDLPVALDRGSPQRDPPTQQQRETAANCVSEGSSIGALAFPVLAEWCDEFSAHRLVGEGAFSKVYLGLFVTDSSVRSVIVKRFESDELTRADLIDSLRREFNILSAFFHPNLIKLRGYFVPTAADIASPPCLVYEHGTRGGLHRNLADPALTPSKRMHIMAGIACGLNYLHTKNGISNAVLHRDLKSANVVLKEDWTPMLIDFGVSFYNATADTARVRRAFTLAPTQAGTVLGTPGYICPVYSKSRSPQYTVQSDIYSFGIVLLEVCFGQLQGAEVDGEEVFLEDTIEDLRTLPTWRDYPQLAEELMDVATSCTASNLKRRYSAIMPVMRILMDRARTMPSSALEGQLDQRERQLFEQTLRREHSQAFQTAQESRNQRECLVCMTQCAASEGVLCSEQYGHFLCDDCFDQEVARQLGPEQHDRFVASDSAVACAWCSMARPPVVSPYSAQTITAHASAAVDTAYREACVQVVASRLESDFQQRLHREVERALAMSRQNLRTEASPEELARQLRNLYPNARMCGRCGFGPVDHMACNDLRLHHGDRVGTATINNHCPQCDWFANDINLWPRWDGRVAATASAAREGQVARGQH